LTATRPVHPEQLLRTYFRAKDENRPHLLADVFSSDARLEIHNRSDQISFPALTVGQDEIADILVRRFNQTYENIYSFCLDRPQPTAATFRCDWLVGMTEKASRNVRVGCGQYEWTFARSPALLVTKLVISVEHMAVHAPNSAGEVLRALRDLDYPWTSAAQVTRALSIGELSAVNDCIARLGSRPLNRPIAD